MILLLQKGIKSLQLRINEYLDKIHDGALSSLTGSAFSQARKKLHHTVFRELNNRCIVPVFYEGTYNVWDGLRILAVDGSKIRLPLETETEKEFGRKRSANSANKPYYSEALASVLYDVGNRIVLGSFLEPIQVGERELARRHLDVLDKNEDLVIYDRGYMGYLLFALHIQRQILFLCRCQKSSYLEVRELFEKDCAVSSKTITITPSKEARRNMQLWGIKDKKLKESITVRFVRVVLKTGEIEVLATTLLDEEKYPNEIFADLYNERWGAETYYDIIKNRLECEHFSGKSAESVRQDFFSTIFLTNLESIVSKRPEDVLGGKTGNRYPQKVNKNVSFNALKYKAYELLASDEDIETTLERLERLFLMNPTIVRKERAPPRKQISDYDRNRFLKHSRKHCF